MKRRINWWISYNKETMTLHLGTRKHSMWLQCPFASWWKARKYFKRPKLKFYCGRTCKKKHIDSEKFGIHDVYEQKGFWPAVSTEWLRWNTFKWLPVYIYSSDIGWKDKWDSPRYERPGYFIIYFGRSYQKSWQIGFSVTAPTLFRYNDCTKETIDEEYWESLLWYVYYSKKYGMSDYKIRDIVKARNTMRNSHWTSCESRDIENFKVLDSREDGLFDERYYIIKVESEELKHLCGEFPSLKNNNVTLRGYKGEEQIYYSSSDYSYCKYDWEFKDNVVELWNIKSKPLNDNPSLLKQCDRFIIEYHYDVDLGPTFKDEYLTKKGIKEIRNWKKWED